MSLLAAQKLKHRLMKRRRCFQVRDVPNPWKFNQLGSGYVARCLLTQLRILSERSSYFFRNGVAADHRAVFLSDDEQRRHLDQTELVAHRLLINHLIGECRSFCPTRELAAQTHARANLNEAFVLCWLPLNEVSPNKLAESIGGLVQLAVV